MATQYLPFLDNPAMAIYSENALYDQSTKIENETHSATGERLSSLQIPEETESARLSIENYAQGIYFCKIIPVNGLTESIRFVIIHR